MTRPQLDALAAYRAAGEAADRAGLAFADTADELLHAQDRGHQPSVAWWAMLARERRAEWHTAKAAERAALRRLTAARRVQTGPVPHCGDGDYLRVWGAA